MWAGNGVSGWTGEHVTSQVSDPLGGAGELVASGGITAWCTDPWVR